MEPSHTIFLKVLILIFKVSTLVYEVVSCKLACGSYVTNPVNHDGVTTHVEPDILECKVKWALGRNTMSKEIGGEEIAAELFQILKGNALKVLR